MATADLTAQRLREVLDYDPESGLFRWKQRRGRAAAEGQVAGTPHPGGYICIKVFQNVVLAHRLAWLYVHGEWPKNKIDHMNGVRNDNRLCNLRDVSDLSSAQNQRQVRSTSRSGVMGVRGNKSMSRWSARICVNYRHIELGFFDTKEEAAQAYWDAKRKLHDVT